MMKKRNLYVLMAALVLASCSKNEDQLPMGNVEVEFGAQSSVIDVNTTRAAYEGTSLSTNPLTALVLTSASSYNYNTLYCNGTMTFASIGNVAYNKPVASGAYVFPAAPADNLHYLSALYPATGWVTTSGKASRTLTGKEDVMFAPQVSTKRSDVTTATPFVYPTLAFTHKLTFLRLFFSGDADAIATASSTTVTDVQLTQINGAAIPTAVEVNLSTATQPITFTGTATTLPCYDGTTDNTFAVANASGYAVTASTVEKAYTLAPPATYSTVTTSYEYTFKVNYTVAGIAKSLNINVDLSAATGGTLPTTGSSTEGYAFNIDIKFLGGQIVAEATVVNWTNGGTVNINL